MDELLAEIMRRAEERWGDGACEGPYARQEIVEGVREVLDELKADAAKVVDLAAELVMDDLARKASDAVDRALAPRCRCTVLPVEP